jgi:hypothetical protein
MIHHISGLLSIAAVFALAGCAAEAPVATSGGSAQPSAEGAAYLLAEAPADAQDVIPMRKAVEDEEDVVVVGRIGGSASPWVDGMAAFSLVDRSLPACTDIPGDTCPTPWDYCCATDKLPAATTLVKVVDDQGKIVTTGAQELLGLDELQTVVVRGKASKDEAGNITVLASGIYVDPSNPGQVKRAGAAADHDHDHAHDHDHDHEHEGDKPADDDQSAAPESGEGNS